MDNNNVRRGLTKVMCMIRLKLHHLRLENPSKTGILPPFLPLQIFVLYNQEIQYQYICSIKTIILLPRFGAFDAFASENYLNFLTVVSTLSSERSNLELFSLPATAVQQVPRTNKSIAATYQYVAFVCTILMPNIC